MGAAEPARPWPGRHWRALVHEIAWAAVQRSGEHADLEWLPAVVEGRLAHRVDLFERAGATEEELAAARDELVAWAEEVLTRDRPKRRKGGALSRCAWPVRLR